MKVSHLRKFAHSHLEVMLHFTISIYALTKFIPKVSLYPLSINVYTKGGNHLTLKLVIVNFQSYHLNPAHSNRVADPIVPNFRSSFKDILKI